MAKPVNLQKCHADEMWECMKQWEMVKAGDLVGHIVALELVRNNVSGYHKNQFFVTLRVTNNAHKTFHRLKWQGFTGMNVIKIVPNTKD